MAKQKTKRTKTKLGRIDVKNPPAAGTVFVLNVPEGTENPTGESTANVTGDKDAPDRFELKFIGLTTNGGMSPVVAHVDLRDGQKFVDSPDVKMWNKEYAPFVVEVRPPDDEPAAAERRDPREIGQYSGVFDPTEPWPEGSIIRFDDGDEGRLREINLEDGAITICLASVGPDHQGQTYFIDEWNKTQAPQVSEVIFLPPSPGEVESQIPNPKSEMKPPPRADLVMIPVDNIDDSHNIRTDIGEKTLVDLQASISNDGLLQPVIVRKVPGGGKTFRLVAGHRRLEAARRAGEEFIEAKLYAVGVNDAWEARARLAENTQRQSLNHIELANVFGQAADAGMTVKQIAEQSHVSDDSVRRHLALRRLTKPVADLVASGFSGKQLPVHHAELIARVGDAARQIELAGQCLALGWDAKKGAWKDRPAFTWREGDPKDYIMPMAELRKHVSYAMCGLAAAGWIRGEDQTGEAFHPVAGRGCCIGCDDNTATYADQPMLFAGLRPKGSAKKGYCTNRPCYETKSKAWEKAKEKRRKEAEKKTAQRIEKAKAAGLEVCESCGAMKDTGKSGLCAKCTEKAKRQADPYGHSRPEREFPKTPEEMLAVALARHGEAVLSAIKNWASDESGTEEQVMSRAWTLMTLHAANAVCRPYGSHGGSIRMDVSVAAKDFPKPGDLPDMLRDKTLSFARPSGLLPSFADMHFPARPEYRDWAKSVGDVPIPAKAMLFLDCAEAFCRRYEIEIPKRPTAGSTAQAELRREILVCKKDDLEELLKRVDHNSVEMLEGILTDAEGGALVVADGGKDKKVKLAKYKDKAIMDRIGAIKGFVGDPRPMRRQYKELRAAEKSDSGKSTAVKERFVRDMAGRDGVPIVRVESEFADGGFEGRCADGVIITIDGSTPTVPAMQSEINAWRNERESRVLNIIRQGRKKEALAMINIDLAPQGDWMTPAELLHFLRTADRLGLTGDWRRAAVAKRIEKLEAE